MLGGAAERAGDLTERFGDLKLSITALADWGIQPSACDNHELVEHTADDKLHRLTIHRVVYAVGCKLCGGQWAECALPWSGIRSVLA